MKISFQCSARISQNSRQTRSIFICLSVFCLKDLRGSKYID